jgi:hypothetical protein
MDDQRYREYCLDLLGKFAGMVGKEAQNSSEEDPIRELAEGFAIIATGEGLYERGPGLAAQLFASCPQLAPAFPRELLWFIGGDCLHYMPDEELAVFQQLEEIRAGAAARGEVLDFHAEKAKLLKLQ